MKRDATRREDKNKISSNEKLFSQKDIILEKRDLNYLILQNQYKIPSNERETRRDSKNQQFSSLLQNNLKIVLLFKQMILGLVLNNLLYELITEIFISKSNQIIFQIEIERFEEILRKLVEMK
jgi:hypothetical protein